MIKGRLGRSRYLISMVTGPSAPRDLSSRARPRRSQARRKPESKQSERNANTSNTVDLPLPFGPSRAVRGFMFLNSTSRRARKFRTCSRSIRGGPGASAEYTLTLLWTDNRLDRGGAAK